MTADELIAFEQEIAADFEAGKIAAPVHLAGGNEQQLVDIFKQIEPDDWVCGAWRMHLHCLLKGVPPDELRSAIHKGRSIALCFPSHNIVSSAIVGGIVPIAMGIAWALKRQNKPGKVWTFVGDMTAHAGIVWESMRYASGHDLPLHLVVEDNGMSVVTKTMDVWGKNYDVAALSSQYKYELTFPHVGTGKWVKF